MTTEPMLSPGKASVAQSYAVSFGGIEMGSLSLEKGTPYAIVIGARAASTPGMTELPVAALRNIAVGRIPKVVNAGKVVTEVRRRVRDLRAALEVVSPWVVVERIRGWNGRRSRRWRGTWDRTSFRGRKASRMRRLKHRPAPDGVDLAPAAVLVSNEWPGEFDVVPNDRGCHVRAGADSPASTRVRRHDLCDEHPALRATVAVIDEPFQGLVEIDADSMIAVRILVAEGNDTLRDLALRQDLISRGFGDVRERVARPAANRKRGRRGYRMGQGRDRLGDRYHGRWPRLLRFLIGERPGSSTSTERENNRYGCGPDSSASSHLTPPAANTSH